MENTTLMDGALRVKLICGQQLLDQLFEPNSRPSLRWLRSQTKAKTIPSIKIGHLRFFDITAVRAALAARKD